MSQQHPITVEQLANARVDAQNLGHFMNDPYGTVALRTGQEIENLDKVIKDLKAIQVDASKEIIENARKVIVAEGNTQTNRVADMGKAQAKRVEDEGDYQVSRLQTEGNTILSETREAGAEQVDRAKQEADKLEAAVGAIEGWPGALNTVWIYSVDENLVAHVQEVEGDDTIEETDTNMISILPAGARQFFVDNRLRTQVLFTTGGE